MSRRNVLVPVVRVSVLAADELDVLLLLEVDELLLLPEVDELLVTDADELLVLRTDEFAKGCGVGLTTGFVTVSLC